MGGVLKQVLSPLRRAAVMFFRLDLTLVKKDDGEVRQGKPGLRIVLQDRGGMAGQARPQSVAERDAERERVELTLMREQLALLLAEQPAARQTMRHLVFVEHALEKKGLRALHKLPLDVLQRALEQLEGLVTNWSPTGLASMRSRMAVAIIDREHSDPAAEADAYRTSAVLDASLLSPAPPGAATELEVDAVTDDALLAAAYAAMGHGAGNAPAQASTAPVDLLPELGSPSARAMATRSRDKAVDVELDLRELQG